MNKPISNKLTLMIIALCLINCQSKVNEKQKNKKTENEVENIVLNTQDNNIKSSPKKDESKQLLANHVIFKNDTILVEDDLENYGGKVWGITKFNSDIYYYMVFKAAIKETDIGESFIRVKNKKQKLLWSMSFSEQAIRDDNSKYLILINYDQNKVTYYNILNGDKVKTKIISDSIHLGDIDYVANSKGLYIKLVNDDFTFKRIMLINNKDGNALNGFF